MIEKTIQLEERLHIKCYRKDGIWIAKGDWRTSHFSQMICLTYEEFNLIVDTVNEMRGKA